MVTASDGTGSGGLVISMYKVMAPGGKGSGGQVIGIHMMKVPGGIRTWRCRDQSVHGDSTWRSQICRSGQSLHGNYTFQYSRWRQDDQYVHMVTTPNGIGPEGQVISVYTVIAFSGIIDE